MKPPLYVVFLLSVLIIIGCKKEKLPPEVNTGEISGISSNSASCGGEIISTGSAKIQESGICWSTDHPPTIADARTTDGPESGEYNGNLTGLISSATYYVRAYATNRYGTGYGETRTFTTPYNGEYITDYDGNVYHAVTIGTQVWMLENLRVTHFRNGVPIEMQLDSAVWDYNSYLPGYCFYNNEAANIDKYGLLYNAKAILDTNLLAPAGWHIPSIEEFNTLINYLGGPDVAGGKLKEFGTGHWASPNLGASNLSGFTALPGGRRAFNAKYEGCGQYAFYLTSDPNRMLLLFYDDPKALLFVLATGGAVRCIKD